MKIKLMCIGIFVFSSLNAMNSHLSIELTNGTEDDKQLFINFHSKSLESLQPNNITKHWNTIFNSEKKLLETGKILGIHIKLNGEAILFISCILQENNKIISIRQYAPKELSLIPVALPIVKDFLLKNYPHTKLLFVTTSNEPELDTFKKSGFSESDIEPEEDFNPLWTSLELQLRSEPLIYRELFTQPGNFFSNTL